MHYALVDALDVQIPRSCEAVAAQRAVQGVVRVGGHGDMRRRGEHHEAVIEAALRRAELDQVSRQELPPFRKAGEGARPPVGNEKLIEVAHRGPGGRSVRDRAVEPAGDGGVIHHARSGKEALGGEIRAVAP